MAISKDIDAIYIKPHRPQSMRLEMEGDALEVSGDRGIGFLRSPQSKSVLSEEHRHGWDDARQC